MLGLDRSMEFNLHMYDCAVTSWQRTLQPATTSLVQDAQNWVQQIVATGATGTGVAVAEALRDPAIMTVILITDGAPNCGASGAAGHLAMIQNANVQGAEIHTFGIAASGSYRQFLQDVAATSGGIYVDVP